MATPMVPPPTLPPMTFDGTVVVVGPQYCAPYPVDLTITQKALSLTEGDFVVTDINENVLMKVKGKLLSLRDKRVLVDGAGNPIVTMQEKLMTAHRRWNVFRGESTDPKDLLFTVRKSSFFQLKTKLDVFLAKNTQEEACDFRIKGSYSERSCTVHVRDSNTIAAQMHRKHKIGNVILGKDTYGVTIYPNVDYAFIITLIVILDQINDARRNDWDTSGIEDLSSFS